MNMKKKLQKRPVPHRYIAIIRGQAKCKIMYQLLFFYEHIFYENVSVIALL